MYPLYSFEFQNQVNVSCTLKIIKINEDVENPKQNTRKNKQKPQVLEMNIHTPTMKGWERKEFPLEMIM